MVNAEAAPPPDPSDQERLTDVAEAAAAESPVGADGAVIGGAKKLSHKLLSPPEILVLITRPRRAGDGTEAKNGQAIRYHLGNP